MRIVTTFTELLSLNENKVNLISFENTNHQMKFRAKLEAFFKRKEAEDKYVVLASNDGVAFDSKQFYYVNLDFSSLNLETNKETDKLLKELLLHQLNHESKLIDLHNQLEDYLYEMFDHVKFEHDETQVQFEFTEKALEQLIKNLKIEFNYKDLKTKTNFEVRKLLIKALLSLNLTEKSVFLVLNYPEAELAPDMYAALIDFLKNLNVTVLILTHSRELILEVDSKELQLVNKNGIIYDIMKLRNELKTFNLIEDELNLDQFTKKLSYQDFIKDYDLLSPKYKRFLKSSTHYSKN